MTTPNDARLQGTLIPPPLKLKPSPRLYIPAEALGNLARTLHSPFLRAEARRVLRDANRLLRTPPLAEGVAVTYQAGTRAIDSRLQCLTTAWVLTHRLSYRQAAVRHLAGLLNWRQISCEATAGTPAKAELPFCLTYGELSHTVGLMFDLFQAELTAEERSVFFAVLDRFLLRAALRCLEAPPWWAYQGWTNWNAVCCGGMGVLALAFYDEQPETHRLLPFVEQSLDPYFRSLAEEGGGCHEGTGYWNYGMNYAIRYVLSWEQATGQRHPALAIREVRRSLHFPVDFTGLSFGDNDRWHPSAFYFLLAKRLNLRKAALRVACFLQQRETGARQREHRVATGDLLYAARAIPTDVELEKLRRIHQRKKVPLVRLYRGLDWVVLADNEWFPTLRLSIRGGSARVKGHGFVDLLNFRCRVQGELMITDQTDPEYLTTTFGRRGTDLYTRGPESKSTLFVEGLGCAKEAACDRLSLVRKDGIVGVRIEATHIYGVRLPVKFIGRLFLFVDSAWWLVIDQVLARTPWTRLGAESRFHTYAACRRQQNAASLHRRKAWMQMTFAALQRGVLQESRGMPARPVPQTTILRWMGQERVPHNLHVVALHPGRGRIGLNVEPEPGGTYRIEAVLPGGRRRRIRLGPRLTLR